MVDGLTDDLSTLAVTDTLIDIITDRLSSVSEGFNVMDATYPHVPIDLVVYAL